MTETIEVFCGGCGKLTNQLVTHHAHFIESRSTWVCVRIVTCTRCSNGDVWPMGEALS